MHKLTKETLDESRLRDAVDEETFLHGRALYDAGQAEVFKIAPTSAICTVSDRRNQRVEILVKDNYLYLKCDCRHASRGLICEHEIAACFATRAQLVGLEPPKWRTQVERLARSIRSREVDAPQAYVLVFSLQQDPYNLVWKIVPYELPERAFPPEYRDPGTFQDPAELYELIQRYNLAHRLKSSNRIYEPAGCLNCSREAVILANLIQERNKAERGYSPQPPLDDYFPLLSVLGAPVYLGDPRNPIQRPLQIHSEVGELVLHLERDEKGLRIIPRLIAGDKRLGPDPLEFEIVYRDPPWLIIRRSTAQTQRGPVGRSDNQPGQYNRAFHPG